jgi:hypothetical protein
MRFEEGNTYGKNGRPLGHKNKAKDTPVIDLMLEVFDLIGGIETYAKWAQEHQTQFYNSLSRQTPVQLKLADDDKRVVIEISDDAKKIVDDVCDWEHSKENIGVAEKSQSTKEDR